MSALWDILIYMNDTFKVCLVTCDMNVAPFAIWLFKLCAVNFLNNNSRWSLFIHGKIISFVTTVCRQEAYVNVTSLETLFCNLKVVTRQTKSILQNQDLYKLTSSAHVMVPPRKFGNLVVLSYKTLWKKCLSLWKMCDIVKILMSQHM